jgi:phage portal protein BeeE
LNEGGLYNGFEFHYNSQKFESIELDDMVYLNPPDGIDLVNPANRIQTLKYPLSNIHAQYHKRNVLLENISAIGILSSRQSDMGGALPMTPEEKQQIQNDWISRNRDQIVITESDVQWTPMSYPTKDLQLFEELTEDKMAIIDAYGLSYYIFSQSKGATFSNVKDGMRMTYQDTIIPETQQMYATISHQIGLVDEGLQLVPDFSGVAVLQDDENAKSSALNERADALNKIILAGVELTEDEKRALLMI